MAARQRGVRARAAEAAACVARAVAAGGRRDGGALPPGRGHQRGEPVGRGHPRTPGASGRTEAARAVAGERAGRDRLLPPAGRRDPRCGPGPRADDGGRRRLAPRGRDRGDPLRRPRGGGADVGAVRAGRLRAGLAGPVPPRASAARRVVPERGAGRVPDGGARVRRRGPGHAPRRVRRGGPRSAHRRPAVDRHPRRGVPVPERRGAGAPARRDRLDPATGPVDAVALLPEMVGRAARGEPVRQPDMDRWRRSREREHRRRVVRVPGVGDVRHEEELPGRGTRAGASDHPAGGAPPVHERRRLQHVRRGREGVDRAREARRLRRGLR